MATATADAVVMQLGEEEGQATTLPAVATPVAATAAAELAAKAVLVWV